MRRRKAINEEIGRRIQFSREEAGLTQEQLAERLSLSPQFISIIERGSAGASLETVIKLCNVLNVSSDWILLGKRDAPTAQSIAAPAAPPNSTSTAAQSAAAASRKRRTRL